MVIENYLNFENSSSFVVHVTLDQTGVLFLGHPVEQQTGRVLVVGLDLQVTHAVLSTLVLFILRAV